VSSAPGVLVFFADYVYNSLVIVRRRVEPTASPADSRNPSGIEPGQKREISQKLPTNYRQISDKLAKN
jgi:hypothetical protein